MPTSFNGAAIFRPRKSYSAREGSSRVHPPSMGPRSSDRGNSRVRHAHGELLSSFNGAAIFRPRKFEDNLAYAKALRNLQWGRDLPTAEIKRIKELQSQIDSLQWGRDLPTAEIQGIHQVGCGADILQWGRDLPTAEMSPRSPNISPVAILQWGRDLPTAEIARLPNIRIVKELSAPREQ